MRESATAVPLVSSITAESSPRTIDPSFARNTAAQSRISCFVRSSVANRK